MNKLSCSKIKKSGNNGRQLNSDIAAAARTNATEMQQTHFTTGVFQGAPSLQRRPQYSRPPPFAPLRALFPLPCNATIVFSYPSSDGREKLVWSHPTKKGRTLNLEQRNHWDPVGGGGEVTDFAVVYIFAPKQNKIDVKSGT
jgi:hypothetical protein